MATIEIHIDDCEGCCDGDETPCECDADTLAVTVSGIANPAPIGDCSSFLNYYSGSGDLFFTALNGTYEVDYTGTLPCDTGVVYLGSAFDWGNPGIKVRDIRWCLDNAVSEHIYVHTVTVYFCCHGGCDPGVGVDACSEGQTRNSIEIVFSGTNWFADGTRNTGVSDNATIYTLRCCTDCFPDNVDACTHLNCSNCDPSGATISGVLS